MHCTYCIYCISNLRENRIQNDSPSLSFSLSLSNLFVVKRRYVYRPHFKPHTNTNVIMCNTFYAKKRVPSPSRIEETRSPPVLQPPVAMPHPRIPTSIDGKVATSPKGALKLTTRSMSDPSSSSPSLRNRHFDTPLLCRGKPGTTLRGYATRLDSVISSRRRDASVNLVLVVL